MAQLVYYFFLLPPSASGACLTSHVGTNGQKELKTTPCVAGSSSQQWKWEGHKQIDGKEGKNIQKDKRGATSLVCKCVYMCMCVYLRDKGKERAIYFDLLLYTSHLGSSLFFPSTLERFLFLSSYYLYFFLLSSLIPFPICVYYFKLAILLFHCLHTHTLSLPSPFPFSFSLYLLPLRSPIVGVDVYYDQRTPPL